MQELSDKNHPDSILNLMDFALNSKGSASNPNGFIVPPESRKEWVLKVSLRV
jgi:hypothetical protein